MEPKANLKTTNERIDKLWLALGVKEESISTKAKPLWRKLYEQAINHKGTSLILAIILCCVGIYGKYWLDHKDDSFNAAVDGRIDKVLSAKGGVKDTLARLTKSIPQCAVLNVVGAVYWGRREDGTPIPQKSRQ